MQEKSKPMVGQDERLVDMDELCRRLSISRITAWRRIRSGFLPPPVSFGGRKNYWPASQVNELIRRLQIAPAYRGIGSGSAMAAKSSES